MERVWRENGEDREWMDREQRGWRVDGERMKRVWRGWRVDGESMYITRGWRENEKGWREDEERMGKRGREE